jgi:hypothetical protein
MFFFEKRRSPPRANQKPVISWRAIKGIKVFCFFSSEKKALLTFLVFLCASS